MANDPNARSGAATLTDSTVGWFGKLPMLGDFASRRLPEAFIAHWDEWLLASIDASRTDLGERWLDAYLTAPIWRFWLGPGVAGDTAWMGILMSSVDRVGRYFPFTAAVTAERAVPVSAAAANWYRGLEDVAYRALSEETTIDALEAALHTLGRPTDPRSPAAASERRFIEWWSRPEEALLELPITPGADPGGIMAAAWSDAVASRARAFTAWWHAPDGGGGKLLGFRGMPTPKEFQLLLIG